MLAVVKVVVFVWHVYPLWLVSHVVVVVVMPCFVVSIAFWCSPFDAFFPSTPFFQDCHWSYFLDTPPYLCKNYCIVVYTPLLDDKRNSFKMNLSK